jgi:hypothetical protein
MSMTATNIDDTNLHNGAIVDPVPIDPEVLEIVSRAVSKDSTHTPANLAGVCRRSALRVLSRLYS